jgi:hypothetical protein
MLVAVKHQTSQRCLAAVWIVLLLLQVACFAHYLVHFRYLPGTDAYYYALQAQSLSDSGHLKVPDSDAVPYLIEAISSQGISVEASFKLVLVVIYAVFNLGFLLLLFRLRHHNQLLLAGLLWLAASSVIAFHVIEFPKLSLGLAFVPLWFSLLASKLKARIFWLALLVAGGSLAHPVVALTALVFTMTAVLDRMSGTREAREEFYGRSLIFRITVCAVLVFAIVFTVARLTARIASLHLGEPGLFSLLKAEGVPLDLKLVVVFSWALLAFVFCDALLAGSRTWACLTAVTLAMPFWPDQDSGLLGIGGRHGAMFVFLAMPLCSVVWKETDGRGIAFKWLQTLWAKRILGLAAITLLAFLPTRLAGYRGLLVSEDYPSDERVVAALRSENIPMLIAHRGLDFFYTYRLRRDAFHFDPEPNWNRLYIWRVTVRITPEEAAYYLPSRCQWVETARAIPGTDYLVIREDCWEQLREGLNAKDNPDLYLEVWQDMDNPSQLRPAFLRAKHRHDARGPFPAYAEENK